MKSIDFAWISTKIIRFVINSVEIHWLSGRCHNLLVGFLLTAASAKVVFELHFWLAWREVGDADQDLLSESAVQTVYPCVARNSCRGRAMFCRNVLARAV